ncbi:MAG: hypothetical protein ABIF01_03180 [Candidatus Micrarchaeota archaeon]
MERKLSPLHIVALIITSLIFIVGLLVGWQLGYTAESQMKLDFEQLRSEGYMLEVLSLLKGRGEMSCPIYEKQFSELSRKTEEYGDKLNYMENQVGKFDSKVMSLKSDYSLMQMRNYLLLKDLDENCGSKHLTILYFYTNEDYSPKTDQGIALADALAGLPEIRGKTRIYHFDVNVRNSVVDALKEQYGITIAPTIIINGKKYEGYRGAEECKGILSLAT